MNSWQERLSNPLFWAILVGWIASVTLHEFAHGLVAHFSGDHTIRERGGLTLNPLQYISPMFSIVLPAICLLIGGIPLPGGVTYIRCDLIRTRFLNSLVSAAGPATNALLCLILAAPLHPAFHWFDPYAGPEHWTQLQIFCAAMALLQGTSVVLNLIPIPPLDGFQMISPYLPASFRQKLTPQVRNTLFICFFLVLLNVPGLFMGILTILLRFFDHMGLDGYAIGQCYNLALFGQI